MPQRSDSLAEIKLKQKSQKTHKSRYQTFLPCPVSLHLPTLLQAPHPGL